MKNMKNTNTGNRNFPYWFVPILFGIIFVVIGLWVLLAPVESYTFITKLIGVILLVSGTTQLIFSVSNREQIPGWGFAFLGGLMDLVFGVILIMKPGFLLKIIAIFVGIWLLVSGINMLVQAWAARKKGEGFWKWELGVGAFYLLLAIIFLWHPMVLGLTIAIWTALAFITLGVFRILLTVSLKKMAKGIKSPPDSGK